MKIMLSGHILLVSKTVKTLFSLNLHFNKILNRVTKKIFIITNGKRINSEKYENNCT